MVDQVIIPSHLLVENYVIPAIHPTRNHSALRNHILRHLLWKWAPCKLFLFPKKGNMRWFFVLISIWIIILWRCLVNNYVTRDSCNPTRFRVCSLFDLSRVGSTHIPLGVHYCYLILYVLLKTKPWRTLHIPQHIILPMPSKHCQIIIKNVNCNFKSA